MNTDTYFWLCTIMTSFVLVSAVPFDERIVGIYYSGWSAYNTTNINVMDIPGNKVTHVFYAFAKLDKGQCILADVEVDLRKKFDSNSTHDGNIGQLHLLKQKYPGLKLLLSVGGWTLSKGFSDSALTNTSRYILARSCAALINTHGFDGIDIDWEHPGSKAHWSTEYRPGVDIPNYTLLLHAIRSELKTGQLLTSAFPMSKSKLEQIELKPVTEIVDFMNFMMYDHAGNWSTATAHHAPFHSNANQSDSLVDLSEFLLQQNVSRKKIVIGIPFYGRAWDHVHFSKSDVAVNHGLYRTHNCSKFCDDTFSLETIKNNFTKANGWTSYWDATSKAAILYNLAEKKVCSYENEESLYRKALYIILKGFRGAFAWEFASDTRNHQMLNALSSILLPVSQI